MIADSLSRDFHIDDSHLANLLLSHFPDQVPFGLTILPVPPNIASWLTAAKGSMVEGTNTKQVCAWLRFQCYLGSIGLQSDPFLDQFSTQQRTKILSAFAHAIREGRFCDATYHKSIKSDSAPSALDCISQVFKLIDRPDPWLDRDGKLGLLLQ